MKSLVVMALMASVSIGAIAERHGGSDKGQDKGQDKGRKAGMFKQLDHDGDGSISSEEHEAAIAKMVEERRQRFKTMDANGDNLVSKKEVAAARLQRKEGHRPVDRAVD